MYRKIIITPITYQPNGIVVTRVPIRGADPWWSCSTMSTNNLFEG